MTTAARFIRLSSAFGSGILETHARRDVEHDQDMPPVFVGDGLGDVDLGR